MSVFVLAEVEEGKNFIVPPIGTTVGEFVGMFVIQFVGMVFVPTVMHCLLIAFFLF